MSTKKLTLNKETLRQLTEDQTQAVAGGTDTCPPNFSIIRATYITRVSVLTTSRITTSRITTSILPTTGCTGPILM